MAAPPGTPSPRPSGHGRAISARTHPDHAERYERADEFVDVVKGLWDCWDDDAIVADRESGVYIDPTKVRAARP